MVNANQEKIYSKVQELEQNSVFVGPVLAKRYWYNYEYRLPDVINEFKNRLKHTYTKDFLKTVKAIVNKGAVKESACNLLERVEADWGRSSRQTLERYLCRWGLS